MIVTEEAQLSIEVEQREGGEDMQDQLHLLGRSVRGCAGKQQTEAGSRKQEVGSQSPEVIQHRERFLCTGCVEKKREVRRTHPKTTILAPLVFPSSLGPSSISPHTPTV